MNNQITFKQYRNVDLLIFSALTALFEAIATFATSRWFAAQPVAISITLTMILIAMHRWSAYAAIIAAAGGAAFCLASSASAEQFLIYCLGNAFALLSLVYFKFLGKEKVKSTFLLTLAFSASAYVFVCLGRWLISLCFGGGLSELVGFLTSDIISLLFAVVLLWVFRGVDGLIEDQKAYVLRLDRQRRESGSDD